MRRGLSDYFFKDIGIDLGTANSLIYLKRYGIVVNEPTFAAINNKTNRIITVGDEAKRMLNRTPAHINIVRPLIGGVISDFDMTQEILRQFFKRIKKGPAFGYRRAVLAIPNGLTEVERKSIEDAVLTAGCAKVYLVESTVAGALGAQMPIDMPIANLIVDIGGGTTDISVISMGGVVLSRSLKVAGDKMNDDIMQFVKGEFGLIIGEPTAETAKIAAGSAVSQSERLELPLRGRDAATGLPKEVLIKGSQVRAALGRSLKSISESIKEVIADTPPELVGDMLKQGIYICGGGALIRGIDRFVEKETSVETYIVENPLTCVTSGLGGIIDDFDAYRHLLDNPLTPQTIKL